MRKFKSPIFFPLLRFVFPDSAAQDCVRCCLCTVVHRYTFTLLPPIRAARIELSRTSSPMTNSSAPHANLFSFWLATSLPSLTQTKHQHGAFLSFRGCFSVSSFPPNWAAIPTRWQTPRRWQFISFTAVCVWVRRLCDCALRFSGNTRGGKHRLIKSSGGPPANADFPLRWRSQEPPHYFNSRCTQKLKGPIQLLWSEYARGRLISWEWY